MYSFYMFNSLSSQTDLVCQHVDQTSILYAALGSPFLSSICKSIQNTHKNNNISDTRSFLLMESHVSSVIGMDADGLKWTFMQDKMARRHVGFGARNGIRLRHKKKPFTAFVLTLILISGDISTNPA